MLLLARDAANSAGVRPLLDRTERWDQRL